MPSRAKSSMAWTSFRAAVCTAPLTVIIPVKETLVGQVKATNSNGQNVPVTVATGKLLVDVKPGQAVTLEITPESN